jgi:hypothetical protein
VLKCKALLVKTKLENVRASFLQRKQCERLTDVVNMLFAQLIKAGLNLVNVARAISCKDILKWSCVYTLSADATAGDYIELPFTWLILRDQFRTEYTNKSVSRRS